MSGKTLKTSLQVAADMFDETEGGKGLARALRGRLGQAILNGYLYCEADIETSVEDDSYYSYYDDIGCNCSATIDSVSNRRTDDGFYLGDDVGEAWGELIKVKLWDNDSGIFVVVKDHGMEVMDSASWLMRLKKPYWRDKGTFPKEARKIVFEKRLKVVKVSKKQSIKFLLCFEDFGRGQAYDTAQKFIDHHREWFKYLKEFPPGESTRYYVHMGGDHWEPIEKVGNRTSWKSLESL